MKRLMLAGVGALVLGAVVWAAGYEALTALLVDLPGWQAEKAQGTDMDMQGAKMTTATRAYKQGDKELTAVVMVGGQAAAAAAGMGGTTMQMENDEQKVSMKDVAGFHVTSTFDKKQTSGTIMVVLAGGKDSGAIFSFTYRGISDDEAMKLAQKFDWKKMQAAAGTNK
jgi:hypothetical protein